jgi:hypothetical protein
MADDEGEKRARKTAEEEGEEASFPLLYSAMIGFLGG